MKSIILLSLLSCALNNLCTCVNATQEHKKLKVEVFYETLCPDSQRFVRDQLYKSIKSNEWLPFIDLEFIPYGKVKVWAENNETVRLFCQHGQRECDLNALHACIVEHNTIEEQLEMINCMLDGYYSDVDSCSKNLNIDVSSAKECKKTRTVSNILKKYGDKTDVIEISFVPSIAIDGVFDRWGQQEILYNFSGVFCRKYKEKYADTLEKC